MVEQARLALQQDGVSQIEFAQGSGEDLSMFSDSSVDLIIAGLFPPIAEWRKFLILQLVAQSAHWFDWSKVWPEIARVLRPGGTVSIWVSDSANRKTPGAFTHPC